MADLESIQKKILSFRNERNLAQFHDPKNPRRSGGAACKHPVENHRAVPQPSRRRTQERKRRTGHIFSFRTRHCQEYEIGIPKEVEEKISMNEAKHPVERAKGSAKKYTNF
jgi:hypothetical protein